MRKEKHILPTSVIENGITFNMIKALRILGQDIRIILCQLL